MLLQLPLPLPLLSTRLEFRSTTRSTMLPLLVPMLVFMDSPLLDYQLLDSPSLLLLLRLRLLLKSKVTWLVRKELAKYLNIDQRKHREENEFANCYFYISIAFSIIYYCFLLRCTTTIFCL